MGKNNYTADTIQKLNFCDAVRKYPGMYIGSKDADGLNHLVKEIVSNSVDEYLNGSCDEVNVTIHKNGYITISDNGRGIPIVENNSKSPLAMCFTEEHAGGKFLNATGESGYNSAGGMHGLGTKCVNALSKSMTVISKREGKLEKIEFNNYEIISHSYGTCCDDEHGVSVSFLPDKKYLEVIEFDGDRIKNMLKEFSFLNKKLSFKFKDERNKDSEHFYSENGLYDYLDYLNNNENMICEPLYFEESEGTFNAEVIFGYNATYNSITKLYTNSIPQVTGHHLTGFRTAFTSFMNSYAREKNWLKEKSGNLTGDDYLEGQMLIINFRMIDPVFKGQNKEELSSTEGRTYVQKFTSKALKDLSYTNEKVLKAIFDKAVNAKKAREAAKKAKDAARTVGEYKKPTTLNLPTKLVDCWGKDRSKCELLICEGDSAAGGLIGARDGEYQAVFPIRGKLINLFKNSNDKVFANQEVVNIVKAIGLELDSKTKKLIYNEKKLRYGKIIMCCDGDPDGLAIRNLLLTCFWSLCPELVLNGHICAAIPPLFRITTKKNEYIFLRDAKALEDYKKQHNGEKFLINRNKGLGEQDADELEQCLLNTKTRNVAQIKVNDLEKAKVLFETFMGESVGPRRQYILEHSEEANG